MSSLVAVATSSSTQRNAAGVRDIKELAVRCIARCPEYLSPSAYDKFSTAPDMFFADTEDADVTPEETKLVLDELYAVGKFPLTCRDKQGYWALHRHEEHMDRYNEDSKFSRRLSVEKIGILQGYREPPYYQDMAANPEHACLLHQATLLADGARAAAEDPKNKDKRVVQIAIATVIHGCTKVHKYTPKALLLWYIE